MTVSLALRNSGAPDGKSDGATFLKPFSDFKDCGAISKSL
jgi:hypothetical protein